MNRLAGLAFLASIQILPEDLEGADIYKIVSDDIFRKQAFTPFFSSFFF